MKFKQIIVNAKIPVPLSDEEFKTKVENKALELRNEFYEADGKEIPQDKFVNDYWRKKAEEQTEKTKKIHQLMTLDGLQPYNGTNIKSLYESQGVDFDKVDFVARNVREININANQSLYQETHQVTDENGKEHCDYVVCFKWGHEMKFHNIQWEESEQCWYFDYLENVEL